MANRNLKDILKPNYGDTAGEIGVAPVIGNDGGDLDFGSNKRLVKNNVRINIGSSPNSNTGDPLRTAFIKVGNFMEAAYIADSDKDRRLLRLEKNAKDSDFRFLGPIVKNNIDNSASLDSDIAAEVGYIDSDTFSVLKPGDTFILTDNIVLQSRQNFVDKFDRGDTKSRIDIDTVTQKNGEYGINAPAFLKMGDDGRLKVSSEFLTQNFAVDFDSALSRLSAGTQDSKLTLAEQQNLYNDLNNITNNLGSFRLDAKNVEDAFAEMMARLVRVGYDAGYYG